MSDYEPIIESLSYNDIEVPGEIKTIKIQLNADLRGYKKGKILKLKTDRFLEPLDRYWRNRLKDSQYDNCVIIID